MEEASFAAPRQQGGPDLRGTNRALRQVGTDGGDLPQEGLLTFCAAAIICLAKTNTLAALTLGSCASHTCAAGTAGRARVGGAFNVWRCGLATLPGLMDTCSM